MKNITWIIILFIVCIFFLNCTVQIKSSDDIIGYRDGVILVRNNEIKLYKFNWIFWTKVFGSEKSLPNGYKNIFSDDNFIGIIMNNNKIQFYFFNVDQNIWTKTFLPDLTLSNGYKSVFGIGDKIGVIMDYNDIQFYEYDHNGNTWIPSIFYSGSKIILPNEYKNVFGFFGSIIGIILDNKIIFYMYEFNNKTWAKSSIPDLALPNGYKNVFNFGQFIGIVIDNKIQLYKSDHDSWKLIFDSKLIIR